MHAGERVGGLLGATGCEEARTSGVIICGLPPPSSGAVEVAGDLGGVGGVFVELAVAAPVDRGVELGSGLVGAVVAAQDVEEEAPP